MGWLAGTSREDINHQWQTFGEAALAPTFICALADCMSSVVPTIAQKIEDGTIVQTIKVCRLSLIAFAPLIDAKLEEWNCETRTLEVLGG